MAFLDAVEHQSQYIPSPLGSQSRLEEANAHDNVESIWWCLFEIRWWLVGICRICTTTSSGGRLRSDGGGLGYVCGCRICTTISSDSGSRSGLGMGSGPRIVAGLFLFLLMQAGTITASVIFH